MAYTRIEKAGTLANAQVATSEVQKYVMIALRYQARNHGAIRERAYAQGNDAIPTPIDRLSWQWKVSVAIGLPQAYGDKRTTEGASRVLRRLYCTCEFFIKDQVQKSGNLVWPTCGSSVIERAFRIKPKTLL